MTEHPRDSLQTQLMVANKELPLVLTHLCMFHSQPFDFQKVLQIVLFESPKSHGVVTDGLCKRAATEIIQNTFDCSRVCRLTTGGLIGCSIAVFPNLCFSS